MAKPLSELLKQVDPEVIAEAKKQAEQEIANKKLSASPRTETKPVAGAKQLK